MTTHPFPRHWRPHGRYYHRSNGVAYGPCNPGETLPDYKTRVKAAYGNLRGVTFHDLETEPLQAYE